MIATFNCSNESFNKIKNTVSELKNSCNNEKEKIQDIELTINALEKLLENEDKITFEAHIQKVCEVEKNLSYCVNKNTSLKFSNYLLQQLKNKIENFKNTVKDTLKYQDYYKELNELLQKDLDLRNYYLEFIEETQNYISKIKGIPENSINNQGSVPIKNELVEQKKQLKEDVTCLNILENKLEETIKNTQELKNKINSAIVTTRGSVSTKDELVEQEKQLKKDVTSLKEIEIELEQIHKDEQELIKQINSIIITITGMSIRLSWLYTEYNSKFTELKGKDLIDYQLNFLEENVVNVYNNMFNSQSK